MSRTFVIEQIASSSVDYIPQMKYYYLNNSTNGSIISDYIGTMYDSGGPSGNYLANELYYFVIRATYGVPVNLFLKSITSEAGQDTLRVYTANDQTSLDSAISLNANGTISTAGFNLIFTVNGTSANTTISQAQVGGYAVTWYSNSSTQAAGFELQWEVQNNFVLTKQLPNILSIPGPLSLRGRGISSAYKATSS